MIGEAVEGVWLMVVRVVMVVVGKPATLAAIRYHQCCHSNHGNVYTHVLIYCERRILWQTDFIYFILFYFIFCFVR